MQRIVFIILLTFAPLLALAENSITWLTETDELSEKLDLETSVSISIDTTKQVLVRLNQFDIEFQVTPMTRVEKFLASSKTYCVSERIKTPERLLNSLFSLPVHIYPSLKLYYPAKHHPLAPHLIDGEQKLTSLKALFDTYPKRVLTLVKGRSYGHFLDTELNIIARQNLIYRSGSDQYRAISQMLLRGRMDYALIFPTTYMKLIADAESEGNVYSVQIAGDLPYILGHIACSKTTLGETAIVKINRILRALYKTPEFYFAHQRYVPKSDHGLLKKNFKQVFLQHP